MKYETRLQMVRFAERDGIKPAAREFNTTVRTVRKWYRRWIADNRSRRSLMDQSKAPRTCPHKTPPHVEKRVIEARKRAPCFGPRRLKDAFDLPVGETAIGRILRQNDLVTPRKKKYEKKRDLREVKRRYKPFEENQVDAKYLTDIPFYVEQTLHDDDLPKFQYTWRDVRTGGIFLGFADELSEAHACAFAAAVGLHLKRVGFDLKDAGTVQTDNGSEFSGAERHARSDRGFSHLVETGLKATHRFIPPGKKNHQADVETLHHWVETEFFDLERFADRRDFFQRASWWQLWWNVSRAK